ncbi:MAG: hypothetical protein KKH04_19225 [Proteobacteria bacterium]|nr:hypothetical protein [Pseudomonadota bacterium]
MNHAKIMGLLQREKFQGPVIFEIFNKPAVPEQIIASFEDNLQACLEAKKAILGGEK